MISKRIYNIFIIALALIPSILIGGCSDNSKFVQKSSVDRSWLGVQIKEVSEKMLKNLKIDHGVIVTKIYENSPAEKADLEEDDILLSFNDNPLDETEDLIDLVRETEINENATIRYLRSGEEQETTVTIGRRQGRSWKKVYGGHFPNDRFRYKIHRYDEERAWLGVSTEELTPQLREYFDVPGKFGLLISEVQKDSPAAKYGLKAGDIILMINRKKIKDHFDLVKALDYFEPEEEVEIEFTRDREEKSLQVKLGKINRKHRYHLGLTPEKLQMNIPEIEIEIPDIDIPDLDLEEIKQLDEKIRKEIEINTENMTERMEELRENLKDIEIKIDLEDSNII